MYKQRYEYREIMEELYNSFEGLADRIFVTSRPSVLDGNLKSFIVIRNSSGTRDRGDTYQTAKYLIHIFVRDKEGGIEDSVELDKITNSICDMMPFISDKFSAGDPNFLSSGSDSGFHYHIIQLSLTINKKTINNDSNY